MSAIYTSGALEEKNSYDGLPCVVIPVHNYSVGQTFDCGQCFRFDRVESSPYLCEYEGIAFGKYVRFAQNYPGELVIINSNASDFEAVWKRFLGLDTDWEAIRGDLMTKCTSDSVMVRAADLAGGIRILRQDPWETLCSFIISQNNNIPRIKKIIASLSKNLGRPVHCSDGVTRYAFPTDTELEAAGEDMLYQLKTGFRAKYLYDAARRSANGLVDYGFIEESDDLEECADRLCEIKGVGPKVAACVLLFGFGKLNAFPVDVWIKRSLERHFPCGFEPAGLSPYAGVAQQYLFYYERYIEGRS